MEKEKEFIGGWSFKKYWNVFQKPLVIVGAIGIVFGLVGLIPLIGWAFRPLASTVLYLGGIAITAYAGYMVMKKYKGDLTQALVCGGIAGFFIGVIKSILYFLGALMSFSVGGILIGLGMTAFYIIGSLVGGLVIGVLAGVIAKSFVNEPSNTSSPDTKQKGEK